MASDFAKRLDDVVREELLNMGHDYRQLIACVEDSPATEGAVVRFNPPYEDVIFEQPEPDLAPDVFAARVRRRLKVSIEAPERPAGPDESE